MLPRFQENVDAIARTSLVLKKSSWFAISPFFLSPTNLEVLSQLTHLLANVHKYLSDDEKKYLQDAQIIRNKCKEDVSFRPQVSDLKLLVRAAKIKQKAERARKAADKGNPFQEINNRDLIIIGQKIEDLLGYINSVKDEIKSKYNYYSQVDAVVKMNNALDALSDEVNNYCSIFTQELMRRINALSQKEIYDIQYVTDKSDWMVFNGFITSHGTDDQKKQLAKKYSIIGDEGVVPLPGDDVYHTQKELGMSFIELPDEDFMKSIVIMSPEELDASLSTLEEAPEKITTAKQGIIKLYDQEAIDDLDNLSTWEMMQESMTMSFQLVKTTDVETNTATTRAEAASISATPCANKIPITLTEERVVISLEDEAPRPVKKKVRKATREEKNDFPMMLYDAISISPQAQLKSLLSQQLQRIQNEQGGCWYNVFASQDMQRKTRDKITALYVAIRQLDQPKTRIELDQFLVSLLQNKLLTQSRGGWLNSTLAEALQEFRQCSMKKRY